MSYATWVPSDNALLLLKYAASTIAAAYGVYATVTDFKEDKDGRKVLTKKGKWGIALFLLSILVNVSSDGFKDIRDRKNAEDEKDRRAQETKDQRFVTESLQRQLENAKVLNAQLSEARKQLDRTANTAASTLDIALRSLDPFEDVVSFTLSYEINTNQGAVQAYLERVKSRKTGNSGNLFPPATAGYFKLGTPEYPDDKFDLERPLSDVVNTQLVEVSIDVLPRQKGKQKHSVSAELTCDRDKTLISYSLSVDKRNKDHIWWGCRGAGIVWTDMQGSVRSFRDLVGATATVGPVHSYTYNSSPLEYSMHDIEFATRGGRRFKIVPSVKCGDPPLGSSFHSEVCFGQLTVP